MMLLLQMRVPIVYPNKFQQVFHAFKETSECFPTFTPVSSQKYAVIGPLPMLLTSTSSSLA